MLIALLLAGAAPQTAVEAERAFAADAQKIGQWSAFRKWAAKDATMFVPQPTKAHAFLKQLKDPVNAVDWWPIMSFVSCDGKMAVNVGGAIWPDGHASSFWTVWELRRNRWRWKVDHGQDVPVRRPRPETPEVRQPMCNLKPDFRLITTHRMMPRFHQQAASPDGTLSYHLDWNSGFPDVSLSLWNGASWDYLSSNTLQSRAMF